MLLRSIASIRIMPALGILMALAACQTAPKAGAVARARTGSRRPSSQAAVAPSEHLILALKYVSYDDSKKRPVLSQIQELKQLEEVNRLYAPCNIEFRQEEYVETSPAERGLAFNPDSMDDLNKIRRAYDDQREIVVINTGKWNHQGGLGADGSNAWTAMPGSNPSGAIIEAPVAGFSSLLAHELGHYLGLSHLNDAANLMNAMIYDSSTGLEPWQCEAARKIATTERAAALRQS